MTFVAGDILEIWRSNAGLADGDFFLRFSVADGTPPAVQLDQDGLTPGALYIYKARRHRPSTSQYSLFGPPVFVTAPYPEGVENMPNTATGVQSLLGIGREIVYGQPVIAQKLIDRKSGSLEMEFADPDHEQLRNITTDIESVPGTSTTSGTPKVTATPEGISRLLCSLLGDPTSVTTAAVTGPPAVSAYQTMTWLDGFNQTPMTLQELKGGYYFVYPGCKSNALTWSLDKTMNTPVELDFEMMALQEFLSDSATAVGLDTAGMDPLPAWGPAQILVKIAGVLTDSARVVTGAFRKNLGTRQVLNGYRGPVSHFANKTSHTGTIDLYFDSDAAMKLYFGNLDAATVPYGASKKVRTVSFETQMVSELNGNGYANSLSLYAPRISYKKVGRQVDGPNEITQKIQYTAYHDVTLGSNFRVQLVTGETLASVLAASTAIGAVPVNGVHPYHLP